MWKRIFICINKSFCCTAEINTTLWINYRPTRFRKIIKNRMTCTGVAGASQGSLKETISDSSMQLRPKTLNTEYPLKNQIKTQMHRQKAIHSHTSKTVLVYYFSKKNSSGQNTWLFTKRQEKFRSATHDVASCLPLRPSLSSISTRKLWFVLIVLLIYSFIKNRTFSKS